MKLSTLSSSMLVAAMLVGCGPDVEGLCGDLDEACPGTENPYDLIEQECIDDGLRLEESADASDCDGAFDDFLDCVDKQNCHWNTGCVAERDAVDRCIAGG